MNPTILVTGATGTIGRELTQALLAGGAQVRLGVRSAEKVADAVARGASAVRFDWADPSSFREAFAGVDHAFLLTPPHPGINEQLTAALVVAKEAGVSFVIKLSALGAAPDAPLALSRLHAEGEAIVRASGIDSTILQPTFFQDNLFNFQGAALSSHNAFFGASGQGKTSYISARDIAEVAAAILRKPEAHRRQTYVLTGGEALTDSEIAVLLSEHAGRPIAFVNLSPEQLASSMREQGTPDEVVEITVGLEQVKAAGWAEAVTPIVASILGRPPERLADFIQRNAARLRA